MMKKSHPWDSGTLFEVVPRNDGNARAKMVNGCGRIYQTAGTVWLEDRLLAFPQNK